MPLFVLTHGVPFPPGARRAAGDRSDRERIIQQEQPEAVIDAVRQVVEGVNEPSSW